MVSAFNSSMGETALLASELENDYSYSVGAEHAQYDFSGVQQKPPPSSYMQRSGLGTSVPGTAARGMVGPGDAPRPMTSNRGAGYVAKEREAFDPLLQAKTEPIKKPEQTPEEKFREMERDIHRLVEASAIAHQAGEAGALDKAKEAGKRERQLCRLREQNGLLDQLNVDLTYCVCLHLALMHEAADNDTEAYQIYSQLVKNKQYQHAGRFRVNMGNVCFRQKRHPTAIKMYRMALDQIPHHVPGVRFKILRNIGHSFFAMRQFTDAIDAYESAFASDSENLDFMTGFNLVLCYYALGDKERMHQGFLRLLAIQQVGLEDQDDEADGGDLSPTAKGEADRLEGADTLREATKHRQREAARYILNAAQLIAPLLAPTVVAGFDIVVDALAQHGFPGIASEMEIAKAGWYLRHKEFEKAVEVLLGFEKKEASLMARAATNLSFLYFVQQDYVQADKYADMAVKADRYNARALTNKGNSLFVNNELDRAKEVYLEAIGVSADCLEAIYNLGLINLQTGSPHEAMLAFDKLTSITHHNCEVMWQLGDLHEKFGDRQKAIEWFSLILTSPKGRPADPGVLSRVASLFGQDDETQAFHYHLEAYRYWPVEIGVITWLGIYHVKQEMYEAALPFFARAADVQPKEVKWKLMVASCYRRMHMFPQAHKTYEEVHKQFPYDLECLRYLVTLCKDMGLNADKHATALRKLERLEAEKEQHMQDEAGYEGLDRSGFEGFDRPDQGGYELPGARTLASPMGFEPARQKIEELADDSPPPPRKPRRQLVKKEKEEEDMDWGDDDLGDDLLPM